MMIFAKIKHTDDIRGARIMKFIFSESGWTYFERLAYRGAIGLFYDTTLQGMLAYFIFFVFVVFAGIGMFATLRWLFTRKKKRRNYY